jgi:predicted metal-binding membrane protein
MTRVTRLMILAAVAGLTILSWLYLLRLGRQMEAMSADQSAMAGMNMPMDVAWSSTDGAVAFGMWAVMMVGMMSPSALPVLFVVARSEAARGGAASRTTALFAVGYLAVWIAFSLGAAALQWVLHDAGLLSVSMTLTSGLGGVVLIGAGVYQLTPQKRACLIHCRHPMDVLMAHWRAGLTGAFRMGLRHGWYCLGCCWALMIVLFGVGIMNLAWVGAIAAFVLLEKMGVGGVWLTRVVGGLLIAAGAMLLARVWGLGIV